MTAQEIVDQENAVLRAELGTQPLWAWKHSSTLRIRVQKILESSTSPTGIDPQYHYKANPATGLIELSPEYVDMPMLPMIPNSWVLCRFVPADQESIFRQRFGVRVEYPVGGIWQPLQHTALKPGVIPTRTDTWNMIQGARANRVAVRDFFDKAEEIQDKRERADAVRFGDMVRDRFSAGMEVPGSKSSASFFNAPSAEPVILTKESV
ncbi:MAG: hypothetical protein EBR82_07265 [Caulobacteraceae bacterium]|nr:hypothetical protein [Caulobacteraceae bacterium]